MLYTSAERETHLQKLQILREKVQFYFLLSFPSALAILVASPLFIQQYTSIFDRPVTPEEYPKYLIFPILLFYWWILFERSEENMEELKNEVRAYLKKYNDSPFHYTMIEQTVNLIMKIAWERSPLPKEKDPGKINWILPKT